MRGLKIGGAMIGAMIVVIVIALVVGIPGGVLTEIVQNRIQRQTGYLLEIDATKFSLRPSPTLTLGGVTLSDPNSPNDRIALSADEVKAKLSLAGLFSGEPRLDEVTAVNPVLRVPMRRERASRPEGSASGNAPAKSVDTSQLGRIGRIVVQGGTLVLADQRRSVENRLDKINADLTIGSDLKTRLSLSGNASGQPLTLEAEAKVPRLLPQPVPVSFVFKAPGLLRNAVTAAADVKIDGSLIRMETLSGTIDDAKFSGSASVDVASKPLVNVDLAIDQLALRPNTRPNAAVQDSPAPSATPASWSDKPFDVRTLNYVDAQVRLAIGTLELDTLRIAPIEIEGSINSGVVRGTLSKIGIYEGMAAAGLAMDAASDTPSFALRSELRQVRALPLLSNAAEFTALDGKLDATINVQAIGRTPREAVASLSGITVVKFQDGQIRGINVARMIRSLTASTLTGWQNDEKETASTDLTELSATFRIDKGQAMTQDFRLSGPLVRVTGIGTIDLNTKAMNFRVEPKLVMSLEGQGGAADPLGLGVPVMVQGPWNKPRIFPDMAGILDNPEAAYAQLRQLGQGLFGPNVLQPNTPGGNAAGTSNNLMNNLGTIIQGLTGKPGQGGNAGQGGAAGSGNGQADGQGGQSATGSNSGQSGSATPLDQIMQKLFGK